MHPPINLPNFLSEIRYHLTQLARSRGGGDHCWDMNPISANRIILVLLYNYLQFYCAASLRNNVINITSAADAPDDPRITASITRRLAFPDFTDEEKTDAITLLGSASVDRESGVIRIPKSEIGSSPEDLANQAGRALYSFPFRMMDPETKAMASFQTTFSFRIDKVATDSNNSSDSGLTFLIVPDEFTVGRNGGWLGMMNDACDESYKPFAVEFDTFKNDEFQDPNDHHVGINFGSIVSRQTADLSSAGVSFQDGSTVRAWINYDSQKRLVDVRVAKEGGPKPFLPLISAPLDLSTIFKEYMFVGFSGGTGSTGQVHSILSWHFSSDSTGILRFPKQETCVKLLLPEIMTNKKHTPSAFIIFCLVILTIFLAAVNIVCISRKRPHNSSASKLLIRAKQRPQPLQFRPRGFSLGEILEATKVFSDEEMLGMGDRGVFYKGVLGDGSEVAIKRFSPIFLQQSCPDHRKLMKQIDNISRLHHPNLVPLRGWCLGEKQELLLIYDYMPNGSLKEWLCSLPWVRRYKVAKEIAGALAFLHEKTSVVHKNVKMSNVLLDVTFRARVGDFGVQLGEAKSKEWWTVNNVERKRKNYNIAGSLGSLIEPPESVEIREATREMDVYKFGVLVLEIVSGKVEFEGEDDVVRWAWKLHEEGRLMEAIDKELLGARKSSGYYYYYNFHYKNYNWSWEIEAECVLKVGLLCTQEDPLARPSMELVVKFLQGDLELLPEVPKTRTKKLLILQPDSPSQFYQSPLCFNLCISPMNLQHEQLTHELQLQAEQQAPASVS